MPTSADGPTEYRRGLVLALERLGWTYHESARYDEMLKTMTKLQAVSKDLVSGPFVDDGDWVSLGLSYRQTGWALKFFRPSREAIPPFDRALAVFRRLATANPTVIQYKLELATCLRYLALAYIVDDRERARDYVLESLTVFRSLPRLQQHGFGDSANEHILSIYYMGKGRIEDALSHGRRSVALAEDLARAHPDNLAFQEELSMGLANYAVAELITGDAQAASRTAGRILELVEPVLREHPEMRYQWNWKIMAHLIEAYVSLAAGRAGDASRAAVLADAGLQVLEEPLSNQEHYFRGVVEAIFYAAGRPSAADRAAQPPGLSQHAELAIAEILEADRMGFGDTYVTAMLDRLLGGRPELRLVIMDELFPANPFRHEPGLVTANPSEDVGATRP